MTTPTTMPPFFFIRHQNRHQKIVTADIAYFEAQKNYVRVVTRSGDYATLGTLKQFLEILPPQRFVRIHRAYVVNLDWVQAFDRDTVFGQDQTLPIGESYLKDLRRRVVLVTGPATKSFTPVD